MKDIVISIEHTESTITLCSDVGNIHVKTEKPFLTIENMDFAVWFFLPIAMRLNRNIFVKGTLSEKTCLNATKLSLIWQSLLPIHFHNISISSENNSKSLSVLPTKDLVFYSGGVDSTYSVLNRLSNKQNQDLLTVHGMEYKLQDNKRFQSLLDKTKPLSDYNNGKRIIVNTDAYQLYKELKINPKNRHITHVFTLAGAAFLFEEYCNYFIAADYRLDQQFLVCPWGSNTATNKFISDGVRSLVTLDDDVSRSGKLPLILESKEGSKSVTFCVNKKIRPQNCGLCSKCMRTKAMFLAKSGKIPNIFCDNSFSSKWYKSMKLNIESDWVFLSDIIACCKIEGNEHLIPGINKAIKIYNKGNSQALCIYRIIQFFKKYRKKVKLIIKSYM